MSAFSVCEKIPYQNERADVASLVPLEALHVLDIGCGTGDLGRLLKKRNQKLQVTGVEVSTRAGEMAKLVLDQVHIGPVESMLDRLPAGDFDCVILADVLEHLVDPWSVLRALKSRLSPAGVVVASVPNVRHYHVWAPLALYGRWDYSEWGLLDSTHLRFFTRSTLSEMFRWAGYDMHVNGANYQAGRYLLALNKLTCGLFDDVLALQYLVTATPSARGEETTEPWWTAGPSRGVLSSLARMPGS